MNFVDIFAGAGGFSEGFMRLGYKPVAKVEMDKQCCDTLRGRLEYWGCSGDCDVIEEEINGDTVLGIIGRILGNGKDIDVLIGSPPCQSFSSANIMLKRDRRDDPKNNMYVYYLKFLELLEPKYFVLENVAGFVTAGKGVYWRDFLSRVTKLGYEVDAKVLNASDYGVLQNRKRLIVLGCRGRTVPLYGLKVVRHDFKLKDLFCDLPFLRAGEKGTVYRTGFDKCSYVSRFKIRRDCDDYVYDHAARRLSERDRVIYSRVFEGTAVGEEEARALLGISADVFKLRYSCLDGLGLCRTVIAHLGVRGSDFIHYDREQCRSITVREAARIQSFPDNYRFSGSMTSKYRQVGNAVPVLLAEQLARRISCDVG